MMTVPEKIIELVERFNRNKEAYLSQGYNEAQLREEFVNPFFEALGWDVRNVSGKAEAYKDVIHEDAIKIGKTTKAPDYSFRIGGTRKFFLETKKPSVNIKQDINPAYQIRRYSWSAKLPLAILTDFEEFAVYDCRKKPTSSDPTSIGRILYIKYTEYVERWDEIADIFSKTAIEQGLFDQYSESVKGKRGTSEVDDEFLKEIERWRETLARNIALRNPGLSVREINFVVQRTVDRIIFLRICEDRGIEPYGQLQELIGKEDVCSELMKIYERADSRYNSGLFHFREEKGRDSIPDYLSPALKIDDKVFKDIFKTLYYPECPYEFSVLGADILGNVYEQFLGKVIRLTPSHRAVVEEKPEIKKAGGVYYTPKYIVEYIVENTVGKLVEGKSPKQISDIRILDPACGSGSFLVDAYSYLLDYHRDWYVEHNPEKHKKEIYQGRGGQWYLTTHEKRRILLNNIFGVDIDSQAVEVTKLNLLLKVLENESQDAMLFQKKLFQERALPDLSNNIKCGNSLIGPDFYDGQSTLSEEEQYRINPFNWEKEFPFKFDAVIGNPPYIRIQAMKEWAPKEVEFYKKKYASASKGNYDIYVVFVEKGVSLLNEGGVLGYILPHKFFQTKYGQPLRKIIAEGRYLDEIVHFSAEQVFKNATTYTCLLFLSNKSGKKKFEFVKVHELEKWRTTSKAEEGKISLNDVTENEWNFTVGPAAEILEKLGEIKTTLGDISERIFQGLITGADPVFILKNHEGEYFSEATKAIHNFENELMHPLCKGSVNIRRYHVSELTKSILFPYKIENGKATLLTKDELSSRFPNAWEYLKQNKATLESRERGKWKHEKWYAFGRTQNLSEMEQSKILTPSIASSVSFTLDKDDFYYFVGSGGGGGGGYGILVKIIVRYEYVLGILNSKLIDFFIKSISTPFSGGYYAYNKQYIEKIPIYLVDPSIPSKKQAHDQVVSLVSRILDLHKRLAEVRTPQEKSVLERQIEATDDQINKLVYELYGLSEKEIRIVEGF